MRASLPFLALSLGFLAHSVAAQELPGALAMSEKAERLAPQTAWNLEYGEARCRLARWFGEEARPHLLIMEQAGPRRQFTLTIAGPQMRSFQRTDSFWLGMERDEPVEEINFFGRSELDGVGDAIVIGSHDIGPTLKRGTVRAAGIDLDEAASIDRLVIRNGRRIVSFETGNMGEVFAALNQCTDALLIRWGLDPMQHRAYVPAHLLDRDELKGRIEARYPRPALSRREEAIVSFTVIVEVDGSVSQCMVDNATPAENLESPACQEMATARFEPARDAEGQPMRSYMSTAITYSMTPRPD